MNRSMTAFLPKRLSSILLLSSFLFPSCSQFLSLFDSRCYFPFFNHSSVVSLCPQSVSFLLQSLPVHSFIIVPVFCAAPISVVYCGSPFEILFLSLRFVSFGHCLISFPLFSFLFGFVLFFPLSFPHSVPFLLLIRFSSVPASFPHSLQFFSCFFPSFPPFLSLIRFKYFPIVFRC